VFRTDEKSEPHSDNSAKRSLATTEKDCGPATILEGGGGREDGGGPGLQVEGVDAGDAGGRHGRAREHLVGRGGRVPPGPFLDDRPGGSSLRLPKGDWLDPPWAGSPPPSRGDGGGPP